MSRETSPETKVAFYKAIKFWLVFVLAVLAAALVWRIFGVGGRGPHGSSARRGGEPGSVVSLRPRAW